MSFGRAFARALGGVVLGWLAMILAISAVLAVALFAALPLWFLSLNANSTRR
ncbi:MAG: hypothetical protein JWR00_4499 [Rubritepida sp.]|nr:hypothetical protein [Rubritepida sp.]